jgi:hypothetical protein
MRSSPTRGRRLGCCWNVEVGFWVESFDVIGDALVLLDVGYRSWRLPRGGTAKGGLVARCVLRDQYPIGLSRSLRLRDSALAMSRSYPGRAGLGQLVPGPVIARSSCTSHGCRYALRVFVFAAL